VVLRWRRPAANPSRLDGFPFPAYLDNPTASDREIVHSLPVRGWIAVRPHAEVEGPTLVVGEVRRALEREPRPGIVPGRRNTQVIGFRAHVVVTPELVGAPWEIEVTVDGKRHRAVIGFEPDAESLAAYRETKRRRLQRIEHVLRCPRLPAPGAEACGGELERHGEELRCRVCRAEYRVTPEHFDFLTDGLRAVASIEDTENVSAHGYDPLAEELIDACAPGLVLDAGSGLKPGGRENVVNFEIVAYPSTDVLGVAESLPFATASFDGALSLAVLEHVRDPFRAMAELGRVVRPGGRVYVAVPFLQPYHGYPHHYFNMTIAGLESLVEPWFTIDRSGTPPYGWPIWTLTWFLNRWVVGLPPNVAEQFKEMRVADLLGSGQQYLDADFVTHLDHSAVVELASVNFVTGTRR